MRAELESQLPDGLSPSHSPNQLVPGTLVKVADKAARSTASPLRDEVLTATNSHPPSKRESKMKTIASTR